MFSVDTCILFFPLLVSFLFLSCFVDLVKTQGAASPSAPPPSHRFLCRRCPGWLTAINPTCPCGSLTPFPCPSPTPRPPIPLLSCLGEWWRRESWAWWLAALWVSSFSSRWPAPGSPWPSHQVTDGYLPPSSQSGTPGAWEQTLLTFHHKHIISPSVHRGTAKKY